MLNILFKIISDLSMEVDKKCILLALPIQKVRK